MRHALKASCSDLAASRHATRDFSGPSSIGGVPTLDSRSPRIRYATIGSVQPASNIRITRSVRSVGAKPKTTCCACRETDSLIVAIGRVMRS